MAVTVVLSEIQRDTLVRLCDTFAPPIVRDDDTTGFWARSASDMGIPDAIEQALTQLPEEQVDGLRSLLDAFADEGLNDADQAAREQMVHAFGDADPDTLAGVSVFKGLTLMLFYALPDPDTGRNPNWEVLGYPGPASAPPE